jgi:hypothetical protein
LKNARFINSEIGSSGDTTLRLYQYRPAFNGGRRDSTDNINRRIVRANLKETFTVTYQTTSATEYNNIIVALKRAGFYCEYDKDSSIAPAAYLYQYNEYTANASKTIIETTPWYSITFYKKYLPFGKEVRFAEDLLVFTSHEYLVHFYGEKNVKKDIYYFSGNDIVKCSVLFINTNRQVIFIWRDGLNRSKIENLLFGGQHKLESQATNENFMAENTWRTKIGVHASMSLFELRVLNQKEISFCGGNAANPGLIFPESTEKIDFTNADIILGCMNCNDDKFQNAKVMYADDEIREGRVLFVLTIALYPIVTGLFE